MPFCPYCGKEVGDGATVCPHCGKNLETRLRAMDGPATKQISGLRQAGLGLGITGCVVMIWAGIGMVASATAGYLYGALGIEFIGLGIFLAGILCFISARGPKS